MKEGTARGKVITVGEDRVVVAAAEGGELTIEVARVQQGDEWVKDAAQLEEIKALQPGQEVSLKWGQDHTGHYYLVQAEQQQPQQEKPRQGLVQGTVITTGEGRVALGLDGGGQMTLEPNWIRRQGEWMRDPFIEAFAGSLKAGDKVVALWQLDEGTHYVVRGISEVDPEGQAVALVLLQSQLRETYQEINELQDQVGQLQQQLQQLLDKQQ